MLLSTVAYVAAFCFSEKLSQVVDTLVCLLLIKLFVYDIKIQVIELIHEARL